MSGIVIYGSQYGTSKQYAEELTRRTGFEAKAYDAAYDINEYESIVYIGAIYASSVLGMKKAFARLADCQGKKIAIATVGLADPADQEYVAGIEGGMKKELPEAVFERASIFHLRGAIDFSKLSFKHKTLLKMLLKMAKGTPENERSADMRAVVEANGQNVSFVDFDSLDQIVAAL